MSTERHSHHVAKPSAPINVEGFAHELELTHDARAEDPSMTWLDDRTARLEDWRAATYQKLGIAERSAADEAEPLVLPDERAHDTTDGAPGEAAQASSEQPVVGGKAKLHEHLTGAHASRKVLAGAVSRLAARRERLEQRTPEQHRSRRRLRTAAFVGASLASLYVAKQYDLPPIMVSSAAMTKRLSKSPNVAATGTLTSPDQSDRIIDRLHGVISRRRARKNRT